MIVNDVLKRFSPAQALAWIVRVRSAPRHLTPSLTPPCLAEPIPYLHTRGRFELFHLILPHIDTALTLFIFGWSRTPAQRLAEHTFRHTSEHFFSDCVSSPNNLPGIAPPALDESKDGMVASRSRRSALLPDRAVRLSIVRGEKRNHF